MPLLYAAAKIALDLPGDKLHGTYIKGTSSSLVRANHQSHPTVVSQMGVKLYEKKKQEDAF